MRKPYLRTSTPTKIKLLSNIFGLYIYHLAGSFIPNNRRKARVLSRICPTTISSWNFTIAFPCPFNLKRYQHVFGQIKETEDKHVDMNLFGLLGIIFWCVISLSCDACCNLISNFTTPDIRYGNPVPCCSKAD